MGLAVQAENLADVAAKIYDSTRGKQPKKHNVSLLCGDSVANRQH